MLYICTMPSGNLPLSQPHPPLTVATLNGCGYGLMGRHARRTLLRLNERQLAMTTQTTINNADVLRTVTVNHMVDGFKVFTKGWPVKFVGPVPSPEQFMVGVLFGKQHKPGPESGFIAMQLRPEGCSVAELCMAFNAGGAAHNHTKSLSTDVGPNGVPGAGYFNRTKGGGKFWLTFTAKGVKALERALQGMAVQQAAGDATVTADKPKAKKATQVAGAKKPTNGAPKPVKTRKVKPDTTVDPFEAERVRAAEMQAEHDRLAAERQIEGPVEPHVETVKPVDQPNA